MNSDLQENSPLILVADDENTSRLVMQRFMEMKGYRIVVAMNGEECLDICQKQQPDMVLLDAIMPGMDGFTCCDQLQHLLGNNCPPVLMVTSLADHESVNRAFKAGADDFITKPINWSTLNLRIRRLLASKSAIAEQRRQIQRECLLTVQLEAANRKLQSIASFDTLTKVANRRYFDDYLEREWRRLHKDELPLSLILCDIDAFKTYNDTHGYQIGDQCLRQVANTISGCKKRGADLVARYSGDQFALVLPNTQIEAAISVAEKIQASVKVLNSECITLSVGVTSIIPSSESSADKLMVKVETAINQAKVAGGDRIVVLLEQTVE